MRLRGFVVSVKGAAGASATASSDVVEPRRRRRPVDAGGAAPVSASQYGHSRQAGSTALPQDWQRSLSLRMQLGQRR